MAPSKDILAKSGVKFGTSGARGLVGQFTSQVCAAFTLAFVDVMKKGFEFDRIAIAIDRRPSSPEMAAACASALSEIGLKIDYYGIMPTPALALKAMQDGIPSIMITGSHIPFDRNGIKFYRPDGEIEKSDELAILQSDAEVALGAKAQLLESSAARQLYTERYTRLFSPDLLAGKRIGVYEHSAAGRDVNVSVLEKLGAEVVSLGRTEAFVPIDTEAVSAEDQQQALEWSNQLELDCILSTDGDGDRPLVADENGRWLRGDILGLLCAKSLGVDALSVPVSCNTAIDKSGAFDVVRRTRIGSPYVIEAMKELSERYERVAGFEANGGFLLQSDLLINGVLLKALPTRDALLPALVVLEAANISGGLSQLVSSLPGRYTASDRLKNFPTAISQSLLGTWNSNLSAVKSALELQSEIIDSDVTDGLRLALADGDVVHLRPSGNAPEFRCYAESDSEGAAAKLVRKTLDCLSNYR